MRFMGQIVIALIAANKSAHLRQEKISIAELNKVPLISPIKGSATREIIEEYLRGFGVYPRRRWLLSERSIGGGPSSRLLKNAHLRRYPHSSSLRRTSMYASLLGISGALHLSIFDQPEQQVFFSN